MKRPRSSTSSTPAAPRPSSARRPALSIRWPLSAEVTWRILVFVAALAILIVVTTHWDGWQGRAGWQSTDDAYLQSDLTPISAKVAGYVRDVPVQDFDRVRAGQTLAEIVDDDYRAAVDQASASADASAAQVET